MWPPNALWPWPQPVGLYSWREVRGMQVAAWQLQVYTGSPTTILLLCLIWYICNTVHNDFIFTDLRWRCMTLLHNMQAGGHNSVKSVMPHSLHVVPPATAYSYSPTSHHAPTSTTPGVQNDPAEARNLQTKHKRPLSQHKIPIQPNCAPRSSSQLTQTTEWPQQTSLPICPLRQPDPCGYNSDA